MYRRSQEVELLENPTQSALIMVPTAESKQGKVYLTNIHGWILYCN